MKSLKTQREEFRSRNILHLVRQNHLQAQKRPFLCYFNFTMVSRQVLHIADPILIAGFWRHTHKKNQISRKIKSRKARARHQRCLWCRRRFHRQQRSAEWLSLICPCCEAAACLSRMSVLRFNVKWISRCYTFRVLCLL